MPIRQRIRSVLTWCANALQPPRKDADPNVREAATALRYATEALTSAEARESMQRQEYVERCHELYEARQMAGTGPWHEGGATVPMSRLIGVREANPLLAQGAYGDIELALQNVEWRREVNLSWLEFSRWGIQQIILISRLYYIKNPIVRRLIDIVSTYVFGRGFEVTSPDEAANEVLKDFFQANSKILGQHGLCQLEKRKYYDGNLFFCFFADTASKGTVQVRMIDATEIQDIITDPDDVETHWYYHRVWAQRIFDPQNGAVRLESKEVWYPALGFDPKNMNPPQPRPETIGKGKVMWDNPVLHRKSGYVAHWLFGCPIIYPALDWARASRRFLEACATVKASLAQIAMTLTTKGGQQALQGAKGQLQTTVGPSSSLWDTNPTAVNASVFASGPGTTLEAFKSTGAGGDPEEVRQYKLMCCMVVGVPETFLGDVSTGNLATATTLDRPTELVFNEKQEIWREDLVTISKYVLSVSSKAAGGKLKEALDKRNSPKVVFMEAKRVVGSDGRMRYVEAPANGKNIEVMVTFPAIREGDVPQLVHAIAEAMTLDNKGGQVVGIDEKTGVGLLLKQLGVENSEDVLEEMYPESEYDPDRTQDPLPAPIMKARPNPGGVPQLPDGSTVPPPATTKTAEALRGLLEALARMGKRVA